MMRRDLLDRIAPDLSNEGFKILFDILVTKRDVDLNIIELPYGFMARRAGESKFDLRNAVDFVSLLAAKFMRNLVPLRFLSFLLVGGSGVAVQLACPIKLPGKACHRLDNGDTVRAPGQIANKAAVDLDGVERKAAQVTERGEGRTKVVERDANTLLAKPVEGGESTGVVAQEYQLGDFKFKPLGDKSGEVEGCFDRFVEIGSAELRRREIDGHPTFSGQVIASLQA